MKGDNMDMDVMYKSRKEKYAHLSEIKHKLLSNEKFVDIRVDNIGAITFKHKPLISSVGSIQKNELLDIDDGKWIEAIHGYNAYNELYAIVEEYYAFNFINYVREEFDNSRYHYTSNVNFVSEDTVEIKSDYNDKIYVRITEEFIYLNDRLVKTYDVVTNKKDANNAIKKFFHIIEISREYINFYNN